MECPEIRELAAFVETQTGDPALVKHVTLCDACQDAIKTLEEEVVGLQIPLSEIWFREHISCLHSDLLAEYRKGQVEAALAEYLKFHIEDLGCQFCQARLGEAEVAENRDARRIATRSKKRLGEATSVLLKKLRKEQG